MLAPFFFAWQRKEVVLMIAIGSRILCESCFMEIKREPCKYCGFDSERSASRDMQVLKRGSTLDNGRYIIGDIIGRGGFGITYIAYDTKLEKRIALKEYYPLGLVSRGAGDSGKVTVTSGNEAESSTFRYGADRFYEEAEMLHRFNGNRYIVSVDDFFRDNDTVYFTMGYLSGETLKTYLKTKGHISEGQAVKLLDNISSALNITHSENVLHRDISPDNIMLCSDGSIKLIDFGAARQVSDMMPGMTVMLKRGFAPPEQYMKKGKLGPWTDIYALGATIYTAMTGEELDEPNGRLADDSDMAKNKGLFSEELWRIVDKATRLKAEERYQNIADLKKDLQLLKKAVAEEDFPVVEMKQPATPEPPGGKKNSGDTPVSDPGEKNTVETELISSKDEGDGGTEWIPSEESDKGHTGEGEKKPDNVIAEGEVKSSGGMDFFRKNPKLFAGAAALLILLAVIVVWRVTKDTDTDSAAYEEEEATEATSDTEAASEGTASEDATEEAVTEETTEVSAEDEAEKGLLSGECGENASFVLDEEGTLTISGTGAMTDFEFDENSAKTPWWDQRDKIKKVVIEEGITTIGTVAFMGLSHLESAEIGNSVTEIHNLSFSFCSTLKSFRLPDNLKELGPRVFFADPELEEISISEDNEDFVTADSVLFVKNMKTLCCYPAAKKDESYEVPDTVERLFTGAFGYASNLKSLTLPEGLKYIDAYVFRECTNISNLQLPSTLEKIGEMAFRSWHYQSVSFKGNAPGFHEKTFAGIDGDMYVYYRKAAEWPSDVMRPYGGTVYWREVTDELIPNTGITTKWGTRGARDFNNLFDKDTSTEWFVDLSEAAHWTADSGEEYRQVEVEWEQPKDITPKSIIFSAGSDKKGSVYDAEGIWIKAYDQSTGQWDSVVVSEEEIEKAEKSDDYTIRLDPLKGNYRLFYISMRIPASEGNFHMTEIKVK